MEIAVTNSSTTLSNVDCCFLVQACAEQLVEFCRSWGLDPIAVSFYSNTVMLPVDDVYLFEYVDKLDVPDAIAYHSVDALGRPYGRMLPPSNRLDATDLSHEIIETAGDPGADRWSKRPDGSEEAVECADPVQGTSYSVPVEVLGETRQIILSDYVLGSYFDPEGKAPYDRQGVLTGPFSIAPGGYAVIIDAGTGTEHSVFGRLLGTAPAGKLRDPGSRLVRRLRETRP